MPREIVRNAADDVGTAFPEIDPAVAIEIDRKPPIASGHELRHAHRTGKRALRRERRDALLMHQ